MQISIREPATIHSGLQELRTILEMVGVEIMPKRLQRMKTAEQRRCMTEGEMKLALMRLKEFGCRLC